jgi:hypothetical protein
MVACAPIRERVRVFGGNRTGGSAGLIDITGDSPSAALPFQLLDDVREIIAARNVLPKAGGDCETPSKTITKVCGPTMPDGIPSSLVGRAVRVGQSVTCTVTITDPTVGAGPVAGTATVTLTNATFPGGSATADFACVSAGATTNTCSFTETIFPTNACGTVGDEHISLRSTTGQVVINAQVVPVRTGVNLPIAPGLFPIIVLPKPDTGIVCPGDVAPIFEADTIIITCVTPVGVSLTNPFPSPIGVIGGLNAQPVVGALPGSVAGLPLAVGVLPGAVSCVAEPAFRAPPGGCPAGTAITLSNPQGAVVAVGTPSFCRALIAPGTFEVSSLSGSILTLSGTLSTNVRIPCGSNLVSVDVISDVLTSVNLNTCAGVRFSVLGLGVGNVEIRVRYEPAPDFGQRELETSGFVTFVAPAVGVSLTLNPDPVQVGMTGTATAFLNQLFIPNCGTVACVDPATGLPITVGANPGSVLNGLVVFTVGDTAIARFNEPTVTATAGTTLNVGVFATANQVAKLCGAFSGGSTAVFTNIGGASAPLAPFFGGCTQVSTTYVGVNPGTTQIAASFIPFLPGVSSLTSAISGPSTSGFALGPGFQTFNFFSPGIGPATAFRVLQVAGAAPATTIRLVPGCNNVVAPATETVAQLVARVDPSSAALSFWKQIPGTVQFQGAPASGTVPAGVANLTGVNALDAIFVCVSAASNWRIT